MTIIEFIKNKESCVSMSSRVSVTLPMPLSMMKSQSSDDGGTLAIDRWNVEKKRAEWDKEFKAFRENQIARCRRIRIKANKSAVEMYERIFFTMRWSNPSLPLPEQELILRFCDHYTGAFPEQKFTDEKLLRVWVDKQRGTAYEKTTASLLELCDRLKQLVLARNSKIDDTVREYHEKTEKMTIKKDGELRWKMEKNKGRRDRYWTIWFLSSRNLLAELKRLVQTANNEALKRHGKPPIPLGDDSVESSLVRLDRNVTGLMMDINEKDPDFGMTALHYAVRGNHADVVTWLLQQGADENACLPDGRSALHLAAQYATREMVLELLSHGADYYGTDNYGCTPLDLAIQNKNNKTIPILQNWNKLLPPEDPPTPPPEEDLTFIPEEYLVTPEAVLNLMSPMLQLLARRLDGQSGIETQAEVEKQGEAEEVELDANGVPYLKAKSKRKAHSFGLKMDVCVEMRLCQKHSRMCFKENIIAEGIKSMRRRWFVARNYITEFYDQTSALLVSSAEVSHQQESIAIPQNLEGGEQVHSSLLEQNTVFAVVQSLENTAVAAAGGDEPQDANTGSNGDDVAAEAFALSAREIIEPPAVVPAPTHRLASPVILPITAYEAAMELAEKLCEMQQEGFASCILRQCIELLEPLDVLTNMSLIAMQTRRCEILLCVHDLLIAQGGEESERTIFPVDKPASDPNKLEHDRQQGVITITSDASKRSMGRLPTAEEKYIAELAEYEGIQQQRRDNEMLERTVVDSTSGVETTLPVLNNAASLQLTDTAVRMICGDDGFEEDRTETQLHGRYADTVTTINSNADFANFSMSSGAVAGAESGFNLSFQNPDDHKNSQLLCSDERIRHLLQEAQFAVEDAIECHHRQHVDDIVEPVTLSPLLELLSNIFERLEQEEEALKVIKYAVSVLSRTIGNVHEETLRVMLDMLRLQIRISNTPEGFREGARMATEISKYLDALIKTNKDAAQMFAKKVAELLSLARLLEHGDIELPTIDSTFRSGGTGILKSSFRSENNTAVADRGRSKKISSNGSTTNRNVENSPYGTIGSKTKTSRSRGGSDARSMQRQQLKQTPSRLISIQSPPKGTIINSLSYRKFIK